MSRTDEFGRRDEHQGHGSPKPPLDEAAARAGVSHEAAKAEMDRFKGVEHYAVRKIIGQKSLRAAPADAKGPYTLGFREDAGDRP